MRPKRKVKDLIHREQHDKAYVDALNLKPTDLVKTRVAAAVLGLHEVTLRAMRCEDPPRGPPWTKDPDSGVRGAVRYCVGDLWAYAKRNTIDPSKLKDMALAAHRLSQASVRDRLANEAGSALDLLDMDEVVDESDD